MSALDRFHPVVAAWFERTFPAPTAAQRQAWPSIQAGRHVLVAAPTGSGKTFAAFLAAIDRLVQEGQAGDLPPATRILYISPLKALSNDIQRNLETPLQAIRAELAARGLRDVPIRTAVRTGDTSQAERAGMRRVPPHILVTTPESLYILLGSDSGRDMLASCRTVIVDEIHAVAGNKRGVHLALSLQRLQSLTGPGLTRVGLSATQKPLEELARFLVGGSPGGVPACDIFDLGHVRRLDLALELPGSPLEPVMSGEVWTEIYDRLAALVETHHTTIVFVNTRRLAERVARHLSERIGAEQVTAHHGSLAKERRLEAERRLKSGALKALVATASLELGIDIGEVDLVCQIGSTRGINTLLQRAGRAGHSVGGTSKCRLFPLSRDELVECAALLDAVRRGELDRLAVPQNALDVLAQQITAEVSLREWHADALFELVRGAHPYRALERESFDEVVRMLAAGFTTRRGRRGALIHHDPLHGLLRPRRGGRLTAITSGGAIPDTADYQVMLEPAGLAVGTVNEDFAVESLQGDVFQLGNASYRILRVERGTVRVEDAHGQPPSIPFWLGEAPGRSAELSLAVSRLKRELEQCFDAGGRRAESWLTDVVGLGTAAAAQLVEYLAAGRAALGCLPTCDVIVFERFFDESGGMQLVVHSPFGSRVNRAWGLSLRKRFCRAFNFELQAAATEDHIVLSLTQAHSFELAGVAHYLHSNTVRALLVQALCAAPMFEVRWRWAAGIALALPRFRGGKKLPPQIARMNAADLLAAVFPDQAACAENLQGAIEVPDHPLVRQTIRDCLQEAMDVDAFEALLRRIESGDIRIVARDLTEPSPLALEALSARPYAYLDDAPLEERRTQAVIGRRWIDPAAAADLGRLDAAAIARVRMQAWPEAATADELHDALGWLCFLTDEEVAGNAVWPALARALRDAGRAVRLQPNRAAPPADGVSSPGALWVATERRGLFEPDVPAGAALVEILRGRLAGLGPVTAAALAASLRLPAGDILAALAQLESEGCVLRGRFTPDAGSDEWCERGLLARIHRYTVKRLRAEIEPVAARDFHRFLLDWQHLLPQSRMRGSDAVAAVLSQLEGFAAPAAAWEAEILPARIADFQPEWLDEQCRAGRFVWARLGVRAAAGGRSGGGRAAGPIRSTPIVLLARRNLRVWPAADAGAAAGGPSTRAQLVAETLQTHGAAFFDEIAESAGLLPAEVEDALAELVALGLVNSDGYAGLRALLMPGAGRAKAGSPALRRRRRAASFGMADAGRWALVRRAPAPPAAPTGGDSPVEIIVRTLLRRWGVLFFKLLAREADWLPPWRDLLQCCRRLEARGEIRGGRFVAGFSGEQFATAEAIGLLREIRRQPPSAQFVSLSAADPLNLIGILTPGARLPSLTDNRLLYRDGLPIATAAGGEVHALERLAADEAWRVHVAVLRRPMPTVLDDPA